MIFYFCLKFCPPVLAFIHEFSCSSSKKVLLISSHLLTGILPERKFITSPWLFVCLYQYTTWIFFPCYYCVFCYLSCPNFGQWEFLQVASWGFKTCFHFHPQNRPVFKFSDSMRLSKCILYFRFPSPGFNQFFREPWFLLLGTSI